MTDSDTLCPTNILKSDRRGRVRSTAQQRDEFLRQFSRSGLSGPAFCRVAGVHYQTFVGWRKRARIQAQGTTLAVVGAAPPSSSSPSAVRFVEAALSAPAHPTRATGSGLEVRLPCGALLSIADASAAVLAAQLIKALA